MSPKSILQRNADPFVGTVRHPFPKKQHQKNIFKKWLKPLDDMLNRYIIKVQVVNNERKQNEIRKFFRLLRR